MEIFNNLRIILVRCIRYKEDDAKSLEQHMYKEKYWGHYLRF